MNRRSANTTKVFVGSLPAGTTVDELRSLFAPYGGIAECDVVNRCGFLHLENKQLAFKAIDELNNFNFKGSKISVEKGRIKPPSNRNGGGRLQRNGFSGGPISMRGNRDNFRRAPYAYGDYERRGPMRRDIYVGGGYDRGYDNRPPIGGGHMMGPLRPLNDGFGVGTGGPDRRPYMDERRYPDNEFGGIRMYSQDRNMYSNDRPIESRTSYDRRNLLDDRRTLDDRNSSNNMMERRPLMDAQIPPIMGNEGGGSYLNLSSIYDRRPQIDMYNRGDIPSKLIGNSDYESTYPTLPQRGYAGGPGSRRDMSLPRRY